MKISTIITLTLTLLAIICTIIAMASYWERLEVTIVEGSETTEMKFYIRYDKLKVSMNSKEFSTSQSGSVTPELKDQMKHAFEIHGAAYSFSVLAFISLVVSFALVLCSIFPVVTQKMPSIAPMVAKIIMAVSLVFCLISMFVYLGLPNAHYNDCKRLNPGNEDTACPHQGFNKDFYGSTMGGFLGFSGEMKYGPYVSWIAMVIGTALTLGAVIMSFIGGVFKVETPEN